MLKREFIFFLIFIGVFFLFTSFLAKDKDSFGVKTIVIDAGHGGKDGGCAGSHANEKDVALAISLKLGEYIEQNFKDVKVIYTRKTDIFIKLSERAKIANKAKADLFICIHANAGKTSAYGTETYVMGLHKTESNLKVAQRENSSILLEEDFETRYGNFDPSSPESYVALVMRQNVFIDQSLSLAAKIQKQFAERVGRKDRGVKQAGFLVLHQTNMPTVLIETGFLTNKEEEKFLTSKIGQDYLASAIYRAFKEYKKEVEPKVVKRKKELIKKEEPSTLTDQKKKEKVKKKKKDGSEEGIIFKVQIATSSVKKELTPENFNGLQNVSFYEAGGLYRYTIGNEKIISEANSLLLRLKEEGHKDAFMVAFLNGKRISVGEAIKIQAQ